MAFIPPTIDDVRHCSNALSVDPAETDAARAIADTTQRYPIRSTASPKTTWMISLTQSNISWPLTSQTHNKCTNKSIIFVGSFYNGGQQLPV